MDEQQLRPVSTEVGVLRGRDCVFLDEVLIVGPTHDALVLSGELNSEWPEMALKTQKVMMACLESARAGGAKIKVG